MLTIPGVAFVRQAGSGGTSVVWRGRTDAEGQDVAVKIARSSQGDATLLREARVLGLLDAPFLPRLLDVGRIDESAGEFAGRVFVVLSWVLGRPLDSVTFASEDERASAALAVAHDVSCALTRLHDLGFVHGDVKPGNIILRADGPRMVASLIDLGFARELGDKKLSGGTPRYLPSSPGSRDLGGSSQDLWALGVTLAELLDDGVRESERPVDALQDTALPEPFQQWCAALTAGESGARPRASWLVARAGELLRDGGRHRCGGSVTLQASYLRLRWAELDIVESASTWQMADDVAGWLERALKLRRRLAELENPEMHRQGHVVVEPLPSHERARWLVALVGPSAAAWPLRGLLADLPEAAFCERLGGLAERIEPSAWSLPVVLGALGDHTQLASPSTEFLDDDGGLSLALGLSRRPVSVEAVRVAERLLAEGRCPARLLPMLARALRSQGHLARALLCSQSAALPELVVIRADVMRRLGRLQEAKALVTGLRGHLDSEGRAVLGRLLLDMGDPSGALDVLNGDVSAAVSEVRALVQMSRGDTEGARGVASAAAAIAVDDEQRGRLLCVLGMEAHARGAAQEASGHFSAAVMLASRAGAVVEEATYLTGLAAASVDAGDVTTALSSARRAALLWEYWGEAGKLARVLLAQAAAYALVGARHEGTRIAGQARAVARAAGDERAEAFAWMVEADVLAEQGSEAAREAWTLLKDAPDPADKVRALARLYRAGPEEASVVAWADQVAGDDTAAGAMRCDWWGARALARLTRDEQGRDEQVLTRLLRLVRVDAPTGAKGPAMYAGRRLAERLGDGASARLFASEQRRLADHVLGKAGADLRERAEQVSWIRDLAGDDTAKLSVGQIRNLESLLRSFASRDNLRRLLEQVLDALVLWTGVERGVLLLKTTGDKLAVRAARNLARHDLTGEQAKLSESLARKALASREPVVAVDAAGELSQTHRSVHALGLRSVLAVPLVARGEALGVAYLDDRVRTGAFGPQELAWVRVVADVAAMAISDARARMQLRNQTRRAEEAGARLAETLAQNEARLDVAERKLASVEQRPHRYEYARIIGDGAAMRRMFDVVDRVTPTSIPVLIKGESGAGKELVARALHENGPRSKFPFLAENCGAIPENLFESTLFGHMRGAFTGADRPRIGLLEAGDRGTLFLDEVGELPLAMQAKLLRVLEDGLVRPLGGTKTRKVDVRIIAASNKDLEASCERGEFRQDLLYRLNVMTIRVPSLRERPEDIPLLVDFFIRHHGEGRSVRVRSDAMNVLQRYEWPGNVRQLENEMRRALVMCRDEITPEDFSAQVRGGVETEAQPVDRFDLRGQVNALERGLVLEALRETGGNQSKAAILLGVSRYGLLKMMKRLEIDKGAWRAT